MTDEQILKQAITIIQRRFGAVQMAYQPSPPRPDVTIRGIQEALYWVTKMDTSAPVGVVIDPIKEL